MVVDTISADSARRGPGNLLVNIVPLVVDEQDSDCLDGADNDADGKADCDDPTCAASPECTSPLCANETLPSQFPVHVEGELTVEGHLNRFQLCGGDKTREHVFAWQSPVTGRVIFDSDKSDFGAQLSVRRGSCLGPEAGSCPAYDFYDSKHVATGVDVIQGEWLYVMIGGVADSHAFGVGNDRTHYVLDIREGQPEAGALCDDGIDNDGNGVADFYDPGCRGE